MFVLQYMHHRGACTGEGANSTLSEHLLKFYATCFPLFMLHWMHQRVTCSDVS